MSQFTNAPKDVMTRAELKEQRARKKREEMQLKLMSRRTRGNDYYRLSRNGALKDIKQIGKKFLRAYKWARFFSLLAVVGSIILALVLIVYKPTGMLANIAGRIPRVKNWLDGAISDRAMRIGYLAILALSVINFIGARAYGGRTKEVKETGKLKKDIVINRPFMRFVYITLLLLLIGGTFAYDFFIYCGGNISQWKSMLSDPERLWLKVINLGVMNFINLNIADEKYLAKRDQAKYERLALEEMDQYNGNIIHGRNPEDFKEGETGKYRNLYHVAILPTSYSVYLKVTIKNVITLVILHSIPSLKVMLLLSVFNVVLTFLDVKFTIRKQQK